MIKYFLSMICSALFVAMAFAQASTDHTLNDGKVHFRVPEGWVTVMTKESGNPQAAAFQVPDPAIQGSDDTATATVKTREMANAGQFTVIVQDEMSRAKEQPGYKDDPASGGGSAHQYFVTRGKTQYLVRDSFLAIGTIAIQVRCQRPVLDASAAAWNAGFDRACDDVVASLKQ